MLQLSQEQIEDRYDSLPEILKDVLWAVSTADEIGRIGEEHHLEDQKVSRMAKIIGNVIMGFLHPDDLRRELQEVLGIDIRVAASLSREINKRILYPIRDEIRKVYTPIVTEIRKIPTPSQTWLEPNQTWPTPPAEEILKRETPTEAVKVPVEELKKTSPAPTSTPPIPAPAAEPGKPFDRAQGGPFILHREESLRPVLETRVPPAETVTPQPSPAQPFQKPLAAKLEFGGPKEPKPIQEKPKEEIPRIVHYSDLRTPLTRPSAISEQQSATPPLITPLKPPKIETPVPPKPSVPPQPTTQVTPPIVEKKTEATEEKVIDLRSFKIIK